MGDFEWDQGDEWVNNGGRGPTVARILCVADGVAKMERLTRGGHSVRFELPVSFLLSKSCGWKRKPRPSGEEGGQ